MANDTRGVFRLRTLRQENVEGDGVPLDDVWLPHPPTNLTDYGYFSSGYNGSSPGITSRTDRTTFTTDTTANLPSSPIPVGQKDGATLTSLTDMYAAGGWDAQTRVYKMNYASETWVNAPGHPAMIREQRQTGNNAVGPKTAGYIFMGDDPNYPGPQHSTVQKVVYSVDVWSQLPNYPYSSTWAMGAGNQTRGIISGGDTNNGGGETSQSYKFTFSSETYGSVPGMSANASGPGNGERSESAAAGNAEYQWITGGRMPHGMTTSSIKYTYSTDTWDRTPGISRSRRWLQAAGNTTQGYWAGGDAPSPAYSTTDKINYSTDTATAAPGANLTEARSKQFATSPRMNGLGATTSPGISPYRWTDDWQGTSDAGYYLGSQPTPGGAPSHQSVIYKTNFAYDTSSSMPSLPNGMSNFGGVFNTNTVGYISGGTQNQVNNDGDGIVKYDLITETASQLDTTSSRRMFRNNDMGIANSLAGYSGGGYDEEGPNATQSITRKLTFATETETLLPGAGWQSSPSPVAGAGSVGNITTHGYFAGGTTGSPSQPNVGKSDIGKFTYATETIDAHSSHLRAAATEFATSSDGSTGYFYGGEATPSGGRHNYIDKIVFSTDTRSNAPNNLANGARFLNGTGNSSNAYIGGGYDGGYYSYVQKYNISTETMATIPSAAFPRSRYAGGSMGPLAAGKSSIGAPEATPTASTSPLAGSAPNFGIAGGGDVIPGGVYSLFDKLEYSTETNSVLPSSDATTGTPSYTQRSITSMTEAWSNSAAGTHLWKFVYSTSTQNPSPASHTTRNYGDGLTFSNKTEGYFGAGANVGSPGPSYSGGPANSLDKFTFSTSTASQVPDLTASPSGANHDFNTSNVGNQQAGYYAGANSRSMGKYVYATSTPSMTNNKLSPTNSIGPMGAGNAINGYFIAGDRSSTDRIAYSTDTLTKLPGASYPSGDQTWGGGSHSSSDAGYIQGGRSPSAPNSPFNYHWSNTRKLTYSTETLSELPASADISQGRNDYSGFSARQNNNGDAALAPNVV